MRSREILSSSVFPEVFPILYRGKHVANSALAESGNYRCWCDRQITPARFDFRERSVPKFANFVCDLIEQRLAFFGDNHFDFFALTAALHARIGRVGRSNQSRPSDACSAPCLLALHTTKVRGHAGVRLARL